jgi:hypothetical protein
VALAPGATPDKIDAEVSRYCGSEPTPRTVIILRYGPNLASPVTSMWPSRQRRSAAERLIRSLIDRGIVSTPSSTRTPLAGWPPRGWSAGRADRLDVVVMSSSPRPA